ncbi:MAG: class I SAM-dependent methyltransferase [Pirellulaceae bacterium]
MPQASIEQQRGRIAEVPQASSVEACSVCGDSQWRIVYRGHLPWLKVCAACGVERVFPIPQEFELAGIYDTKYYAKFGATGQSDAYRTMKLANAEEYLKSIETYREVGTLVDVGCGLGENLMVGKRRGWKGVGVDRNESAIETCEVNGTFRALVLDWEREPFDGVRIDVVMICDVIEHFYRPDAALRKAHACLRENGLVFLTTPDVESIWARLLGHRWWHYHIDHLWYFSRRTLSRLAENAGFEVLECRPTKKRFALRYIVSILANSEKQVAGKWLSSQLLRFLPDRVLAMQLPSVTEGLTLIGRKVGP